MTSTMTKADMVAVVAGIILDEFDAYHIGIEVEWTKDRVVVTIPSDVDTRQFNEYAAGVYGIDETDDEFEKAWKTLPDARERKDRHD